MELEQPGVAANLNVDAPLSGAQIHFGRFTPAGHPQARQRKQVHQRRLRGISVIGPKAIP
jgi:hypothetical protein